MIETQLTTDFECIFNYAKSDFEISWNDANDLFFNTIFSSSKLDIIFSNCITSK